MKIRHLIALTALALGLAAGGGAGLELAAGNGGVNGGDVHALTGGIGGELAGRKPGASGGGIEWSAADNAIAGKAAGASGTNF